jgi:uncharacterized protein (TIGR03435 family)
MLFLLAAPLIVAAQSFEVASIKQNPLPPGGFGFGPGGGGSNLKISGDRVTLSRNTLTHLVMVAWEVKDFQVDGLPDWARLRDQLFDVEAKVEGDPDPTPAKVRPLLQALLAERFHLKVRRETRALPVYNMVIGKGGPKFKETAGFHPAQPPSGRGPAVRVPMVNKSMSDLAGILTNTVDRPVLDKTGLTATYDFTLEFSRPNRDLPADDDRSVFTAIQQQLGLKLVPAKELVPIILIEHAERLSEN